MRCQNIRVVCASLANRTGVNGHFERAPIDRPASGADLFGGVGERG